MNTVIFRTLAPLLVMIMLLFSVFVLLRGHNEPGGGFIGGLIAASAIAILGMAQGGSRARAALKADPLAFAGFGVVIAALSGTLSIFAGHPFLTSLWATIAVGENAFAVSTPLVFDIGVYFVVLGTLSGVALALLDTEKEQA